LRSEVHIVDDQAEIRFALTALLAARGYAVEGYEGGGDFLTRLRRARGCVLLDLVMPGMSGQAVQEEMARRGLEMPVVVMSSRNDIAAAVAAMKLGAVDFLLKPVDEGDLVAAVERALAASHGADERARARAAAEAKLDLLSPRERQILQGLVAGLSNKAIARHLGLSPRTVEMHRASMMADLAVASLPEALRVALDARLPPLAPEGGEGAPSALPAAPAPPPRPDPAERRRYEEKLRLVLEASGDGAWEWTVPTSEIRLSARLLERLGYRPEDAPERFDGVEGFIHPRDRPRFRAELDAHLEGRSASFACEFRVRTPTAWTWVLDVGSVVDRDPATGAPIRMVGTISDISQRKEEERRGRDAAERLELAVWGAGAGLWDLDLRTGAVRLCCRSRELHGLPADGPELVSERQWAATVHPDDVEHALAAVRRAVDTGAPCSTEYRVLLPGGGVRWILGLGKIVSGADGEPSRVVGLNQDITERKAAELALANSLETAA
jgi:two-component system response regulator FixJ